jgi:hypothetical protein
MACFLLRDRSGISATEFTDRGNTASSTLLHLAVPAPSHLPCIYTEALFAAGHGKETILVIGSKCAGGIGVNRNAPILILVPALSNVNSNQRALKPLADYFISNNTITMNGSDKVDR